MDNSIFRWKQNSTHRSLFVAATFSFLLFQSCATAPNSVAGSKGEIAAQDHHGSPAETKDFKDIEYLFNHGALEEAQIKIFSFIKKHPHSLYLPSVENMRGLLLLQNKQPLLSIPHFRKAIQLNPTNTQFNAYVLYNLASALLEANEIEEAQSTINAIPLNSLNKANLLKTYLLKATIYDKRSLPVEASRQILTVSKSLSETDLKENQKILNKLLDQSLQKIDDVAQLEKLHQDFTDSPVADSVLFRLASRELAVGKRSNGEMHLNLLRTKFPSTPYLAQASALLTNPNLQGEVESHSIGVLLPVTGKFAKFGTRSLQGLQLALGIFGPTENSESKLSLIVEDSGEEPEQAIQSLKKLVQKHHVVAVVGPMLTKGIDQISQQAQELGVPLISLARRAGPEQDYVFQAGLTQQLQTYELARYAIQQLKARRFAILFPNDKLGIEMGFSFWDSVNALGGQVVGIESYSPGETDFRKPIDKLAGLFYTEARSRELEALAKERETNKVGKRSRKTEQFYALKPLVDFEAVFIPDEAKVAGQILPTFDYRDIDHVKFLGTSTWNSPDFLSRAQAYGEQATLVDAYFADSQLPIVKTFNEKYKTTFGMEPTALDAIAYDAGLIVRKVLGDPDQNLKRNDVKEQLRLIQNLPGVTGTLNFKDGQFFRDLRVLQVKNGKLVEASQDPAKP